MPGPSYLEHAGDRAKHASDESALFTSLTDIRAMASLLRWHQAEACARSPPLSCHPTRRSTGNVAENRVALRVGHAGAFCVLVSSLQPVRDSFSQLGSGVALTAGIFDAPCSLLAGHACATVQSCDPFNNIRSDTPVGKN